jgi:peptide deformylase
MKIVKNKQKLSVPTTQCESVADGEKIGSRLITALETTGGVGLAANQVGINKSVCIVKVRPDEEPKVLVNPRIIEASEERVGYVEGCLSLPGKRIRTIRHKQIKVSCDNWANEIEFGPDSDELTEENYWKDLGLAECVCLQHEIGHLNGELMTDKHIRWDEPSTVQIKYGRNERVMIEKNGQTQFIKYKKAIPLIEDGWKII